MIDIVFEEDVDDDERAEALYRLGKIGIKEGYKEAAFNAWELLLKEYPKEENALLI